MCSIPCSGPSGARKTGWPGSSCTRSRQPSTASPPPARLCSPAKVIEDDTRPARTIVPADRAPAKKALPGLLNREPGPVSGLPESGSALLGIELCPMPGPARISVAETAENLKSRQDFLCPALETADVQ
jgi:hypothetical protein